MLTASQVAVDRERQARHNGEHAAYGQDRRLRRRTRPRRWTHVPGDSFYTAQAQGPYDLVSRSAGSSWRRRGHPRPEARGRHLRDPRRGQEQRDPHPDVVLGHARDLGAGLHRPGRALDPERYFIVVVNQIGNGLLDLTAHHRRPEHRDVRNSRRCESATTCAPRSSCSGRTSGSSGWPSSSAGRWARSRREMGGPLLTRSAGGPDRRHRRTRRTTSSSPAPCSTRSPATPASTAGYAAPSDVTAGLHRHRRHLGDHGPDDGLLEDRVLARHTAAGRGMRFETYDDFRTASCGCSSG